jgi:RsiW-degrading membrane proteinase PrsW (M82 family)
MVVTTLVLGLGSVGVAVYVFASGGPIAASISVALAAVSVPLLILVVLWLDRYEPEPRRYLVAALVWGGTVAAALGVALSLLAARLTGADDATLAVVWAPVTEEFGKGLFLVLVVAWRRHQMHGLLDGIVYAALTGIGFAFTENILYYMAGLLEGGVPTVTATFVLRGIVGPFAHPLFTSAIGVGIGIAVASRSVTVRVLAPLVGYLVAVGLHALWNGSVVVGGIQGFLAAYLLAMLPVLLLLILLAVWARRREARMLTTALLQAAQMGWIDVAEIPWVAKMSQRVSARKYAQLRGGKPAARAVLDYQQALTEMAFLHNRYTTGNPPSDLNPKMSEIQRRAAAIRPYVILPPSPPPGSPLLPPFQQLSRG